jgi:hypothetical protein
MHDISTADEVIGIFCLANRPEVKRLSSFGMLAQYLVAEGIDAMLTAEPPGTELFSWRALSKLFPLTASRALLSDLRFQPSAVEDFDRWLDAIDRSHAR